MLEENVENITKSDISFPPNFVDPHVLLNIKFNGYCLIKIFPERIANLNIS